MSAAPTRTVVRPCLGCGAPVQLRQAWIIDRWVGRPECGASWCRAYLEDEWTGLWDRDRPANRTVELPTQDGAPRALVASLVAGEAGAPELLLEIIGGEPESLRLPPEKIPELMEALVGVYLRPATGAP